MDEAPEFGVHFSGQVATDLTTEDFAELAGSAAELGFDQVWLNDNPGYRNVLVALTAMGIRAPIDVGTSVLVPYLRNPIELAGTIATLAEVVEENILTVGLGRGSPKLAGDLLESPRPYRMLREYTGFLRRMLDGETVRLGEYELLTSYFNLQPDGRVHLEFPPRSSVRFLLGGHGPTAMEVAGKFMDGTILAHTVPLLRSGALEDVLSGADAAAANARRETDPKHVAAVSVSIADDRSAARRFPRAWIAQTLTGTVRQLLSDEDLAGLGIDLEALGRLQAARDEGGNIQEIASLVTEDMIDATFVAGTPEECVPVLDEMIPRLTSAGVDQVTFLHLGPSYEAAMQVLATDVVHPIE